MFFADSSIWRTSVKVLLQSQICVNIASHTSIGMVANNCHWQDVTKRNGKPMMVKFCFSSWSCYCITVMDFCLYTVCIGIMLNFAQMVRILLSPLHNEHRIWAFTLVISFFIFLIFLVVPVVLGTHWMQLLYQTLPHVKKQVRFENACPKFG